MTQETQTIHVREVGVEAWREARAGAVRSGVTVGEWLTRAIVSYGLMKFMNKSEPAKNAEQTKAMIAEIAENPPLLPEYAGPTITSDLPDWLHDDTPEEIHERTLEPDPDVDNIGTGRPHDSVTMYDLPQNGPAINHPRRKTSVAPEKIPGVTRGVKAKEPLWKDKKKKQLL